jgi:hypothetical protein
VNGYDETLPDSANLLRETRASGDGLPGTRRERAIACGYPAGPGNYTMMVRTKSSEPTEGFGWAYVMPYRRPVNFWPFDLNQESCLDSGYDPSFGRRSTRVAPASLWPFVGRGK